MIGGSSDASMQAIDAGRCGRGQDAGRGRDPPIPLARERPPGYTPPSRAVA